MAPSLRSPRHDSSSSHPYRSRPSAPVSSSSSAPARSSGPLPAPGSSADTAIFVDDSQRSTDSAQSLSQSSGSSFSCSSSHLEDSQGSDRPYDPDQPSQQSQQSQVTNSQGPRTQEELRTILEDSSTTDVDMAALERNVAGSNRPTSSTSGIAIAGTAPARGQPNPPPASDNPPSTSAGQPEPQAPAAGATPATATQPPAPPHASPNSSSSFTPMDTDPSATPGGDQEATGAATPLAHQPVPEVPIPPLELAREVIFPQHIYSSDVPGVPVLTYEEVSNHLPSNADSASPNTITLELNKAFNPCLPSQVTTLRATIRKIYCRHGVTGGYTVTAMPATGAQRRVEVTFDSAEAYLAVRDVNIYWKHQRAKVVSRGPALGARYRLVTAHVPTNTGASAAVQAFTDSCGPAIEIDHLWLTHSGPEGRPGMATWTGHIVALLHLEGPDHLEQTPLSFSDLLKFPGFTRMDGRDYEVLFAGRPNYCRICRHRTDPFHTTDVCPTRVCPVCGGPRHGSDHCPYAEGSDDDGSDDTTSDHDDDSQPPAGASSVALPASPPPPPPLPTAPITRSRTGTVLSSSSSGTSSLARSRSETDLPRPRSDLVAAAAPLHKDADEHPSASVPPTSTTTAAGNITTGTLPAGAGRSLSPDTNVGTASSSAAQTASPARPYGTLVADLASRISARPTSSLKPKSKPKGKGKGKAKSKTVDEHQLPIDAFYAAEPGPPHSSYSIALLPSSYCHALAGLVSLCYAVASYPRHALAGSFPASRRLPPFLVYGNRPVIVLAVFLLFALVSSLELLIGAHPLLCEGGGEVKVASFNCGKGGVKARLTDIFSASNPALSNASIILLQECNIRPAIALGDDDALAALLGHHYQPHFRAVLGIDTGILLLSPHLVPGPAHTDDRWTHLPVAPRPSVHTSGSSSRLDLWSVHGPHHHPAFWAYDFGPALALHSVSGGKIIVGGDWNALPDLARDSLHGTPASCPWSRVAPALAPHQLQDVFRVNHPEGRSFTRVALNKKGVITSAKRLDAIWASPSLTAVSSACRLGETTSDHRALSVDFDLLPKAVVAPPVLAAGPRSRWTLHPGVFRSRGFCDALLAFVASAGPPPSLSGSTAVDTATAYLRRLRLVAQNEAQLVGRHLKTLRDQQTSLELEAESLDLTAPAAAHRLPALLEDLALARHLAEDSLALAYRNTAAALAFRPTSWLRRSASKGGAVIPALRSALGVPTSDADAMLLLAEAFFTRLYTPAVPSEARTTASNTLLAHCRTSLPPAAIALLEPPFTAQEIASSLRSANTHSAPGPDGLIYPLLRLTIDPTAAHLAALANGMRAGVPISVTLRTTLLHKKGDTTDLSNYRPISVSDVSIRAITRAAARRLQVAADLALPWTQAAFMPGRRTSTIVGALQGIIDDLGALRPHHPSSLILVFLDQAKAYDRVLRSWLWSTFRAADAPAPFLDLLQSLYSDPHAQVVVNGLLTALIPLRAGLLQGDPLSCAAYNICAQPFMDFLLFLGVGLLLPGLGRIAAVAFADDVVLILPSGLEGARQWSSVEHALSLYGSASGAVLNRDKCGFACVGLPSGLPATDPAVGALLSSGFRPLPAPDLELVHLGHPINLDSSPRPCPLAFARRLEAIGTRIGQLQRGGTDLILRTRLCNGLLTPMLWHATSVGGLPTDAGRQVWQALRRYLFLGDMSWLDSSVMYRPRHLGGLGLIDPDAMFTAQSIVFLSRNLLRHDEYGSWLRSGIAWALHTYFGCPPAILLLPESPQHRRLRTPATRTLGFWGRLIHALANTSVSLSDHWLDADGTTLLELPWSMGGDPSQLSSTWPRLVHRTQSRGWITWGDILWRLDHSRDNQYYPPSWPLGPPSPRAVHANHAPRPGNPSYPGGPGLGTIFGPYWRTLPPDFGRRLMSTADGPWLVLPSSDPDRPIPRRLDPTAPNFPWHWLKIDGIPLQEVRTRVVRLARGPRTPIEVDYHDHAAPDPVNWARAWTELHRVPLSSAALSACFLWMHRRSWLALGPEGPLPCPHPACSTREDQSHCFVSCPGAQAVWQAALPLLRAFGVSDPVPLEPRLVALAWPSIRRRRPRLLLWRTAVVHLITVLRYDALRAYRQGQPFRLRLDLTPRLSSRIGSLLAEGLALAWTRLQARPDLDSASHAADFDRTWASGSSLVRRDPLSPSHLSFSFPLPP